MNFTAPNVNIISFLPEIILLLSGTALLFFRNRTGQGKAIPGIAAAAIILQGLVIPTWWGNNMAGFNSLIVRDNVSILFQTMIGATALLAVAFSHYYLKERKTSEGEYYALILYAVVGMNVMIAGRDLLVIFLGMEILSLSLYVLVGFFRDSNESMEATVKYFLLGTFSSALFLLGVAFFFGALGTTGIDTVSTAIEQSGFNIMLLMMAAVLLCVGLGFKIASVPFHMWAPDTYEGAPMSIASLLSVAPKIAAFAVLLRIVRALSPATSQATSYAIIIMAVTSMIVGNITALRQTGLIRMLAYSGIAQVGFMLIGLLSPEREGGSALMFYLSMYILMNMGAFGAAIVFSVVEGKRLLINDLSGIAVQRPFLSLTMSIFMISLAGIPPTAGFFAKFYIFKTAIEAGYLWIVVVAVIMTVVSLYYYFRVIMVMYMSEASEKLSTAPGGVTVVAVLLGVLAFATILFGIIPGSIMGIISQSLAFM